MFQKSLVRLLISGAVLLIVGSSAAAASAVPINDLIENSLEYDGQTVTVQGEAIGEVLEREEYAWVNISDGGNAIGVWMTLENAVKIEYFGDYKNIGDTLRITGVFSRDCAEHGGEVDIHCNTLELLSPGHHVAETVAPIKILITFVLAALAGTAVIVTFVLRKKRTAS